MGEVHLDSENLFFGFGWTPTATSQSERRDFLLYFAPRPWLRRPHDVRSVETLAESSVHALAWWVRRHFAEVGHVVELATSYGKQDRAVRTVLPALAAEGYQHVTVPWGNNVAENRILQRLDRAGWARGPYVIGSSDRRVPDRMNAVLEHDPAVRATLVMRPDLYEKCKDAWFQSRQPSGEVAYPRLREYGVGHVALHRLTNAWMAEQSASRTRRAEPLETVGQSSCLPLTAEQQWERWLRRLPPKPSADVPLSSSGWIRHCWRRKVPGSVSRPLRGAVVRLYGDAFERGEGPVSWGLACRAAASIALVEAHLVAPPVGLSKQRLGAYHEAWTRLMKRPTDGADTTYGPPRSPGS